MDMNPALQRMLSKSLLHIRTESPFFATLALFARFIETKSVPTAATDGKNILLNADFMLSLKPEEQDGVLLHEVLHAALQHVTRRGTRDPLVWNIAADIVVNGAVLEHARFRLPEGAIIDKTLEHLSVEEVYAHLLKHGCKQFTLVFSDLLEHGACICNGNCTGAGQCTCNAEGGCSCDNNCSCKGGAGGILSEAHRAALETHWQNALQQAQVIASTTQQGKLPAGLLRELGNLAAARIDWRSYLWRFLVRTPTDFQGYDRRFIGRGYYLEALEGESVRVCVAVDTSGSVGSKEMDALLSEVQGILRAYPGLQCTLYYADADIYGPYELTPDDAVPSPRGGGGTDFRPFFAEMDKEYDPNRETILIYLTDGYGTFPEEPPESPLLWVITSGGISLDTVPFGESVRLLMD